MAAAYAAGVLSVEDAVRVSYYRGLCAPRPCSPEYHPGTMMAVRISFHVAEELSRRSMFRGTVCVAAKYSPTSMNLSGDRDAILKLKDCLEPSTFARVLKVEVNYLSHHMQVR